ncbi:MAG: Hsp20/alpha crystallin family protein [Natronomonas sp.]
MTARQNPLSDVERLLEQLQRNFEEAARRWDSDPFEIGLPTKTSTLLDLEDREDELVLTADLPGFERDDIDVRVTDRMFHLDAKHETEEEENRGEYVRHERHWGTVSRSVTLPVAVETDDVEAEFSNGVLTVRMPKQEALDEGTKIDIE